MSASKAGLLAGIAGLLAIMLFTTPARPETRPPNPPAPKGSKWNGPDLDAAKGRAPAKGKGFYAVPEKEDEVLVRNRKGGR